MMTTAVLVDAIVIASICCSAVSGSAGRNFVFRVGVFCRICSWSRLILGTVVIYLDWNKVILCWFDDCCNLFSNRNNVNKDRYSSGCGNSDGNGAGGGNIFNSRGVCYCVGFCGEKRIDGRMRVMVMGFFILFFWCGRLGGCKRRRGQGLIQCRVRQQWRWHWGGASVIFARFAECK